MRSLVRGVMFWSSLAASVRCLPAAGRAFPRFVSSVACCFSDELRIRDVNQPDGTAHDFMVEPDTWTAQPFGVTGLRGLVGRYLGLGVDACAIGVWRWVGGHPSGVAQLDPRAWVQEV
jgi:hypothetical protein